MAPTWGDAGIAYALVAQKGAGGAPHRRGAFRVAGQASAVRLLGMVALAHGFSIARAVFSDAV